MHFNSAQTIYDLRKLALNLNQHRFFWSLYVISLVIRLLDSF